MDSHPQQVTKGNILIVDDTLENLQVLSATLSRSGYTVRGVITSSMALMVARLAPPDLILLDIIMPDTDGYEVCQQLKNDEITRDIPVIFLSALQDVFDKVRAFEVGGVDYITKPFQVEEVLARVDNQLTIQRLSRKLKDQNKQLQQEIEERRKAEKAAAAASQAKSEFLTNMSHELRTPLNAILGFTQIMKRDPLLNFVQQENISIINRSSEHLLELINDILELSKIEAGIIFCDDSNFDLYHLLDSLEEMFEIKAKHKKNNLIFIISPDVPKYIKADDKKLRSCLTNLISNAIKFTDNGSITLRVKFIDNQKSRLLFEVEDTGCGIAQEEIGLLFNAFFQTERGIKAAEGTGVGLAITRNFVHIMGGEISVESIVDKGSIFRFYIRFDAADSSEVLTKSQRQVIGLEPEQETYRILVVDDTQENRLLLVRLLQPIGFEVREAGNGEDAIALWETWQPHLIWMDTRMPVMGGIEATKQIRLKESLAEDKGQRKTVIIALTASAFEERIGEILAAGCDDFVRKPFLEEVIFDKLVRYLGVDFIYENSLQSTNTSAVTAYLDGDITDGFFHKQLATMPISWVKQLYNAANAVNEELLQHLIEQIPEDKAPLADALTSLINDFRLDIILRFSKKIIK